MVEKSIDQGNIIVIVLIGLLLFMLLKNKGGICSLFGRNKETFVISAAEDTTDCTFHGFVSTARPHCPYKPGAIVPKTCPAECAKAISAWQTACGEENFGDVKTEIVNKINHSGGGNGDGIVNGFMAQCQATTESIQPTASGGQDNNTNCIGSWSHCGADCADKTYTVQTPQSGTGNACEAAEGATATCNPGDGNCPEDSDIWLYVGIAVSVILVGLLIGFIAFHKPTQRRLHGAMNRFQSYIQYPISNPLL